MNPEKVEKAMALYNSGLSLAKCAEHFNVTRQSIWSLLSRRMVLRKNLRFENENHFYRGSSANDWAQNKVETELKRGRMVRPKTCSHCGEKKIFKDGRSGIQAHHCDYNKPLEIIWLCQKCHHNWHKNNKAIERKKCGPS